MLPVTLDGYLERVARETAKMSWPGQMHPILHANTKKSVEDYFSTIFVSHLKRVWTDEYTTSRLAYDDWYKQRAYELGKFLERGKHVKRNYRDTAVACKLLNTFMHQLMKYEKCRILWRDLHLVLDGRLFRKLLGLSGEYDSLRPVASILKDNPYKITYGSYSRLQSQLWAFIEQLNQRANAEYKLRSRIELNVLWA